MTFHAYRGNAFEHTHENHAFNRLHDLLQAEWTDREEPLYLWGNFYVGTRELDALIVKRNAIIVVDFKDYGGQLSFSENGRWTIDGVEVKGGSSVNPYQQIRKTKFKVLEFIGSQLRLESTPNLGHISGLALFHQDIRFESDELPPDISRWFHITDFAHTIRSIDAIVSREIALPATDLDALVEKINLPSYQPDGRPKTVGIAGGDDSGLVTIQWTDAQRKALARTDEWLADEKTDVLVLEGMVSTGKRTLLKPLIQKISDTGKTALLIAPNSRIAGRYILPGTECRSIYPLLYDSQADGMVDGRAHHPVHLEPKEVDGRVLVFVEAHLLSNSFFEMDTTIYGSGHILDDLLKALGEAPPKMLLVGDPFQLSRGDLELSLLNAQPLKAKGLDVERIMLNEQIRPSAEESELLDFQKVLVDGLSEDHFNRLPSPGSSQVCEYQAGPESEALGQELTTGYFNAVYLCGKNELAQRVNQTTRQKYLGATSMNRLVPGDKVDFHNRPPILEEADDPLDVDIKWLNAGEIGTVEFVEPNIDPRSIRLDGRKHDTVVDFAIAVFNVPGVGSVRIRYLPDYLAATIPELSKDQIVAMQIWARQAAQLKLKSWKDKLDKLKESDKEKHKEERSRYEMAVHRLMMSDGYYNAARLRFAYAMTVHRAQGRRWQQVIVNAHESSSSDVPNNASYFRWLYTATTCTGRQVTLLKYPRLDPLSNVQWKLNPQCQIGPIQIRRQYPYNKQRVLSEADKRVKVPTGFVNLKQELIALMLSIHDRLTGSVWYIDKVAQHDYQEHYWFTSDTGTMVVGRFAYNADHMVTNVVLTVKLGNEYLADELWRIIEPKRVFQSWEVEEAVKAVEARIRTMDFSLMTVDESPYRAILVIQSEIGAAQLEVNVNKRGMVSSIRPMKATDKLTLEMLQTEFMSQQSSTHSFDESAGESE